MLRPCQTHSDLSFWKNSRRVGGDIEKDFNELGKEHHIYTWTSARTVALNIWFYALMNFKCVMVILVWTNNQGKFCNTINQNF